MTSDERILFLSLNSCWNIDHYYTRRAGINMESLTGTFNSMSEGIYDDWLSAKTIPEPHRVSFTNRQNEIKDW
ncbi:MAG: hypothetical protein GY749_08750 [Desulfobacteraceae bacterium]|nr:hypothetical protein [Desulfobacteraceae bacterium]